MEQPEYGVDLITFFHPGFWGLGSDAEVLDWCRQHPGEMWHRLLAACEAAGTTRLEVTFPPLDFRGALAAFGSPSDVRAALATHGIKLVSAFHDGTDWDRIPWEEAVAQVVGVVGFLAATGAEVLVVGAPMVQQGPVREADGSRAERIARFAEVCDSVATALSGSGVRLAIHTESHSIAVEEVDLRLLMASTDPVLVGLCPDSAHLLLSKNDPVAVVEEFGDRVLLAHWKDAVGPFPEDFAVADGEDIHALHRRYMRPLGTGAVDWPAWAAALANTPAAPVRLLELDAAADPVAELVAARRFVELLGDADAPGHDAGTAQDRPIPATEQDAALLRAAIAVSVRSVASGNHPFGALLVDSDGRIVLEAGNTVTTGRDVTGHAETNLVRAASARWSAEELGEYSLYTSCEPCAMCSGAIYWSGIGRVVYALAETGLLEITGNAESNPTLALPCRIVLGSGQRPIEVVGPQIEDEARIPHLGFWTSGA